MSLVVWIISPAALKIDKLSDNKEKECNFRGAIDLFVFVEKRAIIRDAIIVSIVNLEK